MIYINITVRAKKARAEERARVVCGNSDYTVRFDFDEEWAEYAVKTARFVTENGNYTDVQFEGSDCPVPILRNTRTLLVGVFAGNLRTTTAALIHAVPCITDPDGTPADPTPDVYAQLMERLNELEAPAAVLYTAQNLTYEQKAQARDNIGVTESLGMTGATVGQVPAIKAVDENGAPTEWEAVELPSGAYTVNLTMDDGGNITADKTFAEIKAAYDAGKVVNAKFESTIVPLCSLNDSEAVFAVTNAYSGAVATVIFICTSDNVWSMSQNGFDAHTLGISGASVGQIVKIKTVDSSGVPTEWEAVTNSTPFIVEFSGDGSTAYTSSHTFEQIIDAISAGRYVVGHAEELMVSGDPSGSRYNIYFDLVSTMDVAIFKFVDATGCYQITVAIPNGGASSVSVFGSYLSASSGEYGGVKADSAEETDTQPVRIGTDGKLYTAQVQPDWDQNNSSQPDYIKNRTHKREEVLVPSFTLSGTAEATNEGAAVKEFTVNSKIGEAPTGMSVYCRINGQPPVLLPKIYIPDYIIYEYSTYGYGDPSVFSSSAYVEGAPSVHDNGLDIGVGDDHYKWIIKVSRDSQYFDYEELTLEFGTSFETVYTPLDENYIPMTVPRVAAASAGDILRVKAVDDHGKPTEWEATDMASGGSGDEWEMIADITTDGNTNVFTFTGLSYREIIVDFWFSGTFSTGSAYTTFSVNGVGCRVLRMIRTNSSPAFRFRVELFDGVMFEHEIYGSMGGATNVEAGWTICEGSEKINTFVIGANLNYAFDAGSRIKIRGRK